MLDRLTIERMEQEASEGPILVALSGGGDSVALLHLLTNRIGAARLRAAVVDHALRDGSAQDARRALSFAEAVGVTGDILTLAWPDGPKRAQQATREARYGALCEAARSLGSQVIAVAHSADDQAETILMRAASGSTWRGLAGMAPFAPAPVWPEGRGMRIARPLLGARRAALRACLAGRGAEWIEDPANADPKFERVRVRARLAELESEGFDPPRLNALAQQLRERVAHVDAAAAVLIDRAVAFEDDRALIDLRSWTGSGEVCRRALSAVITSASGSAREPPPDAIERLEAQLIDTRGATLGGALLTRDGAQIVVSRDRGALTGRADGAPPLAPLALPAAREVVWDGRVALTAGEPGWSVNVENGAPILVNGEARAPLSIADPRWLLRDRVDHLLPG